MRKRIWMVAFILLCAFGLAACKTESVVYAKAEQSADSFSGDVTVLRQENNGYVMQVTVANSGEDFTGMVQVIVAGSNYINSAYNTEITLPAQGKKQFTINVAGTAVDPSSGMCTLNFLDEKGNVLQSIRLRNVFGNAITEIPVGVLSDDYAGLAFMEAKGERVTIRNRSYPVKLMELNGDHLKEQLDGVYFLIIDQFDVSSLAREDIEAIQDWVKDGGWMMIGTGEYAEQTLSGFDRIFLGVDILDISEPGDENFLSVHADPNDYYYYMYTDDGINFTDMAVADLNYNNMSGYLYESSEHPAIVGRVEDGAVMIFGCSLGNEEMRKASRYTVTLMYEELTNVSSGYQFDDYYSEWDYINERLLAFIDGINTNVDFTGLKVMIILYVVLIGPVLYLILRRVKKREWYWICVPVLGVLFIAGVYFLGQGARVRETRVYSVTAQRVDSSRKDTYYLAYHSGTKPWVVPLHTDYEMAGPGSGWDSYFYWGNSQNTDDYYYMINNDVEGLSVGMKPEENFESGFFYAGGRAESKGTISCENLTVGRRGKAGGTVTNGTDCDMAYMAVWLDDHIMVFSDVKEGETVDLNQAMQNGRCVYENVTSAYFSVDDLLYDMVSIYSYNNYDMGYEQDDMAALLIGLGIAEKAKPTGARQAVIIGVVRDYDKMAAGKCNETSYGCLYSYAEAEGGQNASY